MDLRAQGRWPSGGVAGGDRPAYGRRRAVRLSWHRPRRDAPEEARAVTARGDAEGRTCEPGQEPVPGQHESRDPHADERGDGTVVLARADGAERPAKRLSRQDAARESVAAWRDQRCARSVEDRGGRVDG